MGLDSHCRAGSDDIDFIFSPNFSNGTMAHNERKRKKLVAPTYDDVMILARAMWRRDVHKERALTTEDAEFRSFFDCCVEVFLTLWTLLDQNNGIPDGGKLVHLLWTLMFLKTYAKLKVLCAIASAADKETYMLWVWKFIDGIVSLHHHVVSFFLYSKVVLASILQLTKFADYF